MLEGPSQGCYIILVLIWHMMYCIDNVLHYRYYNVKLYVILHRLKEGRRDLFYWPEGTAAVTEMTFDGVIAAVRIPAFLAGLI